MSAVFLRRKFTVKLLRRKCEELKEVIFLPIRHCKLFKLLFEVTPVLQIKCCIAFCPDDKYISLPCSIQILYRIFVMIYEIPFQTCEQTNFHYFYITQPRHMHCTIRFYAVFEIQKIDLNVRREGQLGQVGLEEVCTLDSNAF